jgi:hypothetical protein
MSHFYGTLKGNRGEATRCGTKNSGMITEAASWEGKIVVRLFYNEEKKEDWCSIHKSPHFGQGEHTLIYIGPIGKEADIE